MIGDAQDRAPAHRASIAKTSACRTLGPIPGLFSVVLLLGSACVTTEGAHAFGRQGARMSFWASPSTLHQLNFHGPFPVRCEQSFQLGKACALVLKVQC